MIKKELTLQEKQIEVELIYKEKKNISIKIDGHQKIIVSAPMFLSEEDVIRIIIKKERWILNKLQEIKPSHYISNRNEYISGEVFLYLGKEYILQLINSDNKDINIHITNDKLIINTYTNNTEIIKATLHKWYRERAIETIGKRTMDYSRQTGLIPSKIIIKNQKSRWGSCNSKREIRLNWRLIMAPVDVIDYVVIHELCHLKHMNHSKDFWQLVEFYMSNYKEKRLWLKENGIRLMNNVSLD